MEYSNSRSIVFNFSIIQFIFICVLFTGCQPIYNTGFVPIPKQLISNEIEIGNDWIEIVPPESIEPLGPQNWILLRFDYYKELSKNVRIDHSIILNDGRTVKIEAVLFDNQGNTFDFFPGGYGGGGVHLYDESPTNAQGVSLNPKRLLDRKFTKMKIRSSALIRVDKIEWVSAIPK
jgi:hypothetical protein